MYAIRTESRYPKGTFKNAPKNYVYLVDRQKTKEKWWTDSEPELIKQYATKEEAQEFLDTLQFNKPTIIKYSQAMFQVGILNN